MSKFVEMTEQEFFTNPHIDTPIEKIMAIRPEIRAMLVAADIVFAGELALKKPRELPKINGSYKIIAHHVEPILKTMGLGLGVRILGTTAPETIHLPHKPKAFKFSSDTTLHISAPR